MELERTHTQPRDPNTREHVIDNYGNNERGNNNDNLKQYAKNCIAESVTVQLVVKPEKTYNLERRGNVLLPIPRKQRRVIKITLFCIG